MRSDQYLEQRNIKKKYILLMNLVTSWFQSAIKVTFTLHFKSIF